MKRHLLIKKIEAQERKLALRSEVISVVSQHAHFAFRQVHPGWLVGSGMLAGVLVNRIGINRAYTLGFTGIRLFPMVSNAFNLGRHFGAQG
ncbi:hypothetical protein [Halopseudomonas sabulinigri]|uniref:Uncharacterized protein n=1 Tax=Halopseudomonas sabulinigri TaxID=472181 RepID=A0A1H1RNX8_9GAMM|nr:hypothetical protein [Halopseudomonas sabulinigri]SDS37410.1 hypothetical protein SAMN05216271_1780 [Halopseudomonas sabulinigri]